MATQVRVSQAAELLGVSVDSVRRWIHQGRLAADHDGSGRLVVDGADLARLAQARNEAVAESSTAGRRSARNSFPGLVTKVTKDTVMAQVEIQAGQFRVVSLLSREAVDELGLDVGVLATASVKATHVVVEVPPTPRSSGGR